MLLQQKFNVTEMTNYVQDLLLASKCNIVKQDPDFDRAQQHL
jgi:hypothetical protein